MTHGAKPGFGEQRPSQFATALQAAEQPRSLVANDTENKLRQGMDRLVALQHLFVKLTAHRPLRTAADQRHLRLEMRQRGMFLATVRRERLRRGIEHSLHVMCRQEK